jgi:polyphosphate kinase
VRLEIEDSASAQLTSMLEQQLDLDPQDVFRLAAPLDMRVLMTLASCRVMRPSRSAAASGRRAGGGVARFVHRAR